KFMVYEIGFKDLPTIRAEVERRVALLESGAAPDKLPPCPAWMYETCEFAPHCGCGGVPAWRLCCEGMPLLSWRGAKRCRGPRKFAIQICGVASNLLRRRSPRAFGARDDYNCRADRASRRRAPASSLIPTSSSAINGAPTSGANCGGRITARRARVLIAAR